MATALSIINRAAELIGFKDPDETLSGNDSANFLAVLNDMVDTWNTNRLYIVTVGEVVASVSANPVTIGPSQTIDVPRPTRIEQGSFTRSGGTDYTFELITREQYNSIPEKTTTSDLPDVGYYDAGLPTGNLYLYPAPNGSIELHLQLSTQLSEFADLATDYDLAPGYKKALAYSLAEELAPGRRPLDPKIATTAASARRTIKRVNLEIPELNTSTYYSPLDRIKAGI